MVVRLCQLKSLLLLMLLIMSGCSFLRSDTEVATELLSPIKNEWFASNPEHSLNDQQGKPQPHHFFDVNPELSKNDIYVNAVVIVPEGSNHAYQLDVPSGQRFYSHSYCSQSDVWSQYSGPIKKPTFSIGVIPRLLDQLGEPQKVIIFGGEKTYPKLTDFHQHRIKLIGAAIEQECSEGNCLGRNNWISRMVFVAVNVENKKFENITEMVGLGKIIDWTQTKAVLENLDGRNGGAGTTYPSIRIGNTIKLEEAMEYYRKRSVYLSVKESQKIQKGCHSLYEKLWEEVGEEKSEDRPAKTIEELNAKVKLITELKKKRMPVGFAARLKSFSDSYFAEFTTCQKFVYSGNVNLNSEKFWFLSSIGMFFRLHKDGYFFDCKRQSWQKNNLDGMGKPVYDIKTGMVECKDKDYDYAMQYLPSFLTGLKNGEHSFYKFVDYDMHTFGTHQKLYSWVKVKSKVYDCSRDPNIEIKKELKVFPEDVSWKKRNIKDIADELKIIY